MENSVLLVGAVFFLSLFAVGRTEEDDCENEINLDSVLDRAKKTFQNIKNLQLRCEKNINCTCDVGQKAKAYSDVGVDLIRLAKRKYTTCNSTSSAGLTRVKKSVPADCLEISHTIQNVSGVYTIQPKGPFARNKSFEVYCDMETDNRGWTVLFFTLKDPQFPVNFPIVVSYKKLSKGLLAHIKSTEVCCDMETDNRGWTVIQFRGNFPIQENFFRNWSEYKNGFGRITHDFWLGNDHIYELTHQHEVSARFDLVGPFGNTKYAVYDRFYIDGEENNYTLHISGYSGDAGDSMAIHNGMKFSTFDRKNDRKRKGDACAELGKGGWWYNDCGMANPNGRYMAGYLDDPQMYAHWYSFRQHQCLRNIEIKLKRRSHVNG